ncbi:integrase [Methanococcoides sp.]|uniref:integrase n=1 Tax=Methanococcoides sp. TaxID=1966350 RepID=UPI00272E159B|nr:integrase [Methanococcoides sp.]
MDEDFDGNVVVQPTTSSDVETRLAALDKQVEMLSKQQSTASEKPDGPGEIRTPDLCRVKPLDVENATNSFFNSPSKTLGISTDVVQDICLNDFWETSKDAFYEWLNFKDISKKTKQGYRSALRNFFENNVVHKPKDFRKLQLKDKESRGLRNLLNFCEDEEIEVVVGYSIDKWRRFIKIRKSGVVEVYVTDEEIKEAYTACPEVLKPVFSLLVYSGSRATHIHKMLDNFDERNIIVDGDVAYYPTASFSEGTKKTFQVFFPTSFIPELKSIGKPRCYYNITEKIRHGRVSAKTIRKWHLNMMIKAKVTESIADFIQGRAAMTVGSAHYLNKVQQAKNEYQGVIEKFAL